MPYATQRDRTIQPLETAGAEWPAAPLNAFLMSGYKPGHWEIRWDDPGNLARNSRFSLYGVNIYRSFDSEFGPYELVTQRPLGATYWLDQTDNVLVIEEDVSNQFLIRGTPSAGQDAVRFVFRTLRTPVVKSGSQMVNADSPDDVQVFVDGQPAVVRSVFGRTGEVEIEARVFVDVATQQRIQPVIPGPDSVVTCTYRYNKTFVKTDLITRTFYRLTTVAAPVKPDCPDRAGPLVETPLEYATLTSSMEIEKIDWMWREAVRRNRWILDQGGERVKAFLRKTVGPLCPCRPAADIHRQPISDCHICFKPGTLVRSEAGWQAIETIQVGQRVLSSDGKYHRVRQTFENQFDGELVSILSSVSTQPVLATPNHPFWALRGNHKPPGKCGPKCNSYIFTYGDGLHLGTSDVRLLPSGRWWARAQVNGSRGKGRKALGTYASREEAEVAVQDYKRGNLKPGHVLEWVAAGSLVKKDWLVARWSDDVTDVEAISVPDQYLKTSAYGPQRQGLTEFAVDDDFLWVVGMYLAEGSTGSRTVNFALHAKEELFQARIRAFFHRYGYPSSLVKGPGNGVSVQVHSTTLAQWLPDFLGHLCYNKRIPEVLMSLPVSKAQSLLRGVYDGDGWKGGKEVTQTSEVLALQIVELLHRAGEQPLVRRQVSRKKTPKGNLRRVAYNVNWSEDTFTHNNRKGRWVCKGNLLAQVKAVGRVQYSGPVYNLSVEDDETYVTNGIVVHNCYGTGIVGGYEGPYDILIAPDDAERRISQKETGRSVDHTYEVFTGPSPLVSMRDFFVKINGERYSIGAVRMPTNRGMVLQQHFSIAHIDEKDIRSKVPMYDPTKQAIDRVNKVGPEWAPAPQITDDRSIPEERQLRGGTETWANTTY
jgi:hypothetical protein